MKLMKRQFAGCMLTAAGTFLAAAGTLLAIPVSAHHSGEMFEREKTVTLTGTVKEFQYINPHSWLIVDIDNNDGTTTTWGFEAEGPQDLMEGGRAQERSAAGRKNHRHGPAHAGRPPGRRLERDRQGRRHAA